MKSASNGKEGTEKVHIALLFMACHNNENFAAYWESTYLNSLLK